MASTSQHRCVFVGNIPYDTTEEQLIEICREVGPVVSFRLVIDRETGKPKGYGFCEYKDEETALSARRNLQGYEINGRQLRVDFAENDKGNDKNREQGRGGPGLNAMAEPLKQLGGPVVHGEFVNQQPIGLHTAITAATVMSGALGGSQSGSQSYQNGLQSQLAPASDPLTLHLANMSRSQLYEIMSELKVMAVQNKDLARQLLLAKPQLLKAIFQAQIMLGMMTPQALQMPNIRQAPGQPIQPSLQHAQQLQQPAGPTPSGLPPLAQKVQLPLGPKLQEGQLSGMPQASLIPEQFSTRPQHTMQPGVQHPQNLRSYIPQQATSLGQARISTLPSNPHVRPQISQQMQPVLVQRQGQLAHANNLGYNGQMVNQNTAVQPSLFPHLDSGVKPAQSAWPGFAEKTSRPQDSSELMNQPSKLIKLDDGKSASFLTGGLNVSNNNTGSGPSQTHASQMPVNLVSRAEPVQHTEEQISKPPVRPEMESALLQQVLNLTPEQLHSLPPEQRQQVIQLQQALRRDKMQPP